MAFSSSTFFNFGETLVLTHAEITAFHSIDRSLYARLTINLRRDPFVSMQVTAMWIWLERHGCHPGTLTLRINDLNDQFLHCLFNEAAACLACLRNRNFRETRILHLTQAITGRDCISLKVFHANRDEIAGEIWKIVTDEVCFRVFSDIIRHAVQNQVFPNPNFDWNMYQGQNWHSYNNGGLGFGENSRVEMEAYREFLNDELADVLEQDFYYYINGEEEEEEEVVYYNAVPPEERTIFLTFSKGYPISEQEVAHFFTRKYGDIYEAIRMQQKHNGEQALYARLVLHSDSAIPVVLGTKAKAKFSINGKHVCARKYVRRGGTRLN